MITWPQIQHRSLLPRQWWNVWPWCIRSLVRRRWLTMRCSMLLTFFCPLRPSNLHMISWEFNGFHLKKKIGRLVRATTFSKIGLNSPQAATNLWDSILHREVKNSISSCLLIAIPFDKFKAFLILVWVVFFEILGFVGHSKNPSNKDDGALRLCLKSELCPCNFYPLHLIHNIDLGLTNMSFTFLVIHEGSSVFGSSH